MQITDDETQPEALAEFGRRAVQLLCSEDIAALADLFGYALAFSHDKATAIRQDLASSLLRIGASKLGPPPASAPSVIYFRPNNSGLYALVKQEIPTDSEGTILLELIVTTRGSIKHVTLEEVSAVV